MNRRIVAGILVLAWVGSSQTSWGMQMRDPSAAGSVGMTPIDSIADRINSNAVPSAVVTPSGVPTDPTASGPQARVPTPPVGPNPVGMTTQPNLHESLDQGYPTSGGYGWFFRRNAKGAPANPKANRGVSAPKVDPATIPSRMTWDASGEPTSMNGGAATAPGRASPYLNQVPDLPRRQASGPLLNDSTGDAEAGRPAPLRSDVPRQGRPKLVQAASGATPKPRPQSSATINPRTPPPAGPAPLIPATLPTSEPTEPTRPIESPLVEVPTTDPASATPLPPQARSRPADQDGAIPIVADAAPHPLPEAPVPPPSLPTGPTVVDLGAPPEGIPPEALLAPAVPVAPVPSPAASIASEAVAVAPSPIQAATNLTASAAPNQVDPNLRRTSGDSTALRIDKHRDKDRPFASARAAAVGDEVITVHQVETLVVEKYKMMTAGQQVTEDEKREILNTLGTMALEHLVEQSLVLQEAKRRMKNGKMQHQFDEFVDKRWREDKLPPLLRKTATNNEYELKRKLAEEGQSYAEMQDNFHKDMLEHDFLLNEIKNKVSIDLIQLRTYYNENIQSYHQPARISWREIEVNVAKYPDRAAARRQADAILERLRRKEDFAAVAQSSSDGPTASKGGLYGNMTPGSYGIPAVNDMLNTIQEGEISPVLEAPMSFHIIRVEARRAAGPLPFDEVQKQVAEAVFERNMTKAREQYIAKLRTKTLVRIMPMFDATKNGVDQARRADNNVIPASNR